MTSTDRLTLVLSWWLALPLGLALILMSLRKSGHFNMVVNVSPSTIPSYSPWVLDCLA